MKPVNKPRKKLLAFLLIFALMMSVSSVVMFSDTAEADWEPCTHCGEYRSDDYRCSGCGGCGGELEGSSCWLAHHCPTCSDCYDDMNGRCEECWRCENCVENLCPECYYCEVCAIASEYCNGCSKCWYCCLENTGGYCWGCEQCQDCGGILCPDCSQSDHCAGCSEVCPDCGRCEVCSLAFCQDCGLCAWCFGASWCNTCEICQECEILCNSCPDHCSNCSTICVNCGKCEECGQGMCEGCEVCYTCNNEYCPYCGYCNECVTICVGCGDTCNECTDMCVNCDLCDNCTTLCESCNSYCAECTLLCDGCNSCENCYEICWNCQSACEGCSEICSGCGLCEECGGGICPGCNECRECNPDFCQECGSCSGCVTLCEDCGEYCSECVDMCGYCGYCEYCADLCIDCGQTCSECVYTCEGCGTCSECEYVCHYCGDNCTACGNICPACYEICDECADFCVGCGECEYCAGSGDGLCEGCGNYCDSCAPFCDNCGYCSDCETQCTNCGDYCSNCAELCPNCDACDECSDFCQGCGYYCSSCAVICADCGFCSECETVCSVNADHCTNCLDEFCSNCSACSECADICPDCGGLHCSNCDDYCSLCGVLENCPHHGWCDICDECFNSPTHVVCTRCNEHRPDWQYRNLGAGGHQLQCSCGLIKDDPQGHNLSYMVLTEPTNTDAGQAVHYCVDCDYTKEVVIPATGGGAHSHDYSLWLSNADTHRPQCTCGELSGAAEPHDFVWVIDIEATKQKMGKKHEECSICGYQKMPVNIPAVNHTCSFSPGWNSDGLNHWHQCACGEKKDINSHTLGPWTVTKAATETTAGSQEATCTVCRYKKTSLIPATASHFTVTFDSQGGTPVDAQNVKNTGKAVQPADPSQAGYTFEGWYTAPGGKTLWNFNLPVYEEMTLYAGWKENVTGPPTILTKSLDAAVYGNTYNQKIKASGSLPFEWSVKSGNLPPGLTLSKDGTIAGKPIEVGLFSFTIEAANGIGPNAAVDFTIMVKKAVITIKAVNKNVTIGNNVPDLTAPAISKDYTVAGLASGDVLAADPTLEYAAVPDTSKEGSVTILVSGAQVPAGGNYEAAIVYQNGTLTVRQKSTGGGGGSVVPPADTEKDAAEEEDGNKDGEETSTDPSTGPSDKPETETTPAGPAAFTDVQPDAWYYEAVEDVCARGIMSGTGTGTFDPNAITTRAMFVTILYNMEGRPAATSSAFTDVKADSWYHDAVNWAYDKGIVSGFGDNTFAPEKELTREQLAVILHKYAEYKGYDLTATAELDKFTDADQISDWAEESLKWAVGAGLINGKGDGILDPGGSATRAEAATLIQKFMQNFAG